MWGHPPRRGCTRGLGLPGSGSGGKLSFVGLEGLRPWSRDCGVVTPRLWRGDAEGGSSSGASIVATYKSMRNLCKMQKGKRATTKFGIKINYNS